MTYIEGETAHIDISRLTEKIRLSYDPQAERTRIHEMIEQGVGLGSIHHYLEQQSVKFVLEHILGVKKTAFEYEITQHGLKYPGMVQPVRTMFAHSAELSGMFGRERSELIGWDRIERMLCEHGAKDVVQVSPPSERSEFGNYGMMFHFERTRENTVRVSVNRYDDPTEKRFLTTSRALGSALGLPFDPDRREKHYLENPVDISRYPGMLAGLLQQLRISPQDSVSEELEQLLLTDGLFRHYLDMYVQYCVGSGGTDPSWLLTSMSERAYAIGQQYEKTTQVRNRIPSIPPIFDGTGCLVIPGRMPLPRYLGNGERVVTQCPHCRTRLLLGREHIDKGIQCHCKATVPAGDASRCIIEASRPADMYEQLTLTDAGYSYEREDSLSTETTE